MAAASAGTPAGALDMWYQKALSTAGARGAGAPIKLRVRVGARTVQEDVGRVLLAAGAPAGAIYCVALLRALCEQTVAHLLCLTA